MKKLSGAACFAALLLLMWLSVRAAGVLPMEKTDLIAEKYDSWTGVLRLWTFEGWPSGNNSLTSWLNFAAAQFEKAHPGAYVQVTAVDAQAMRALATSGVNPPDLILFPPGLLESAESLALLSVDAPLRANLSAAGQINGSIFALPVAMGAYVWAYDRARVNGDSAAALPVHVPKDEPFRCWPGALLCLCAPAPQSNSDPDPNPIPALDLGLPLTNAVTGAHSAGAPATSGSAVCTTQKTFPLTGDSKGALSLWQGVLGDGVPQAFSLASSPASSLASSPDAYSDFINGAAAAIPATQREIRRLELLADAGRGPDWAVSLPGRYMFADQLAMIAAVDWPRDDSAARTELSRALIAHLLSAEMQAALAKSRAFPVRADTAAYEGRGAMAQIEAALAEKELIVPPAFGCGWRAQAGAALEDFLAGKISAHEALKRFTGN